MIDMNEIFAEIDDLTKSGAFKNSLWEKNPPYIYSGDPEIPGRLIRESRDGKKEKGHWENGGFIVIKSINNDESEQPPNH